MPGHGALVLPLELLSVPGQGAQVGVRAPTKGFVQTGAHARSPGTGSKCERGLTSLLPFAP